MDLRQITEDYAVAGQIGAADDVSPWNRFLMERADGSRQYLASNPSTGDVEIEHYGADGQRTRIELNERRRQGATFIEQDAQGRALHRRQVALHIPTPTPGVQQQAQLALAERELADPLRARGLTDAQVAQVCAAAVRHCARHASLGAPDRFLLSRDERQIAVLHGGGIYLSEMPIEAAMHQGAEVHLAEAERRWVAMDSRLHGHDQAVRAHEQPARV